MKVIRILLVTAGLAVVTVGAVGALSEPGLTRWPYARYLAVAAILGDFLILPIVLVAGAIAARGLPGWARVPVQGALYVSAAVTVVALPLVLGYGRDPSLPSALPRNYGLGLLAILATVWAAAAVFALVRRRRPSL